MDPGTPQCSRAGCREGASLSVVWRNPRIHTAERRKVWLACAEHAPYLHDFLASRGFPVAIRAGLTDGTDVDLPEAAA
ncbi:hypothetical protein G8E01_06150 [Microbacterium sp. CBS5P-1]|nr:hypothetical protein [Microbacterium excoecariae]NHI16767.1 hypothetical protein [Microbacterium excoecariae]